jgi:hypothetical protein
MIFQSDDINTPIFKFVFDDNFYVRSYNMEDLLSMNSNNYDKDKQPFKLAKKNTKTSLISKGSESVEPLKSTERQISFKIVDFKQTLNKLLKPLPISHQNTLARSNTNPNPNKLKHASTHMGNELLNYFNKFNYNINLFLELFNTINNSFTKTELENHNFSVVVVKCEHVRLIHRNKIANYEEVNHKKLFIFILEASETELKSFCDDVFVFSEGIKNNDENSLINVVVNRKIDTLIDSLTNPEDFNTEGPRPTFPGNMIENTNYICKYRVMRITGEKFQHGLFLIDTKEVVRFLPISNNYKKKILVFELKDIKAVVKYRYLMQYNSINVFFYSRKSSKIFEFESQLEADEIYDYLRNNAPKIDKHFNDVKYHTNMWVDGLISNYDYLMYLNTMACRSFSDLSQYPVMPWVITNFEDEESK